MKLSSQAKEIYIKKFGYDVYKQRDQEHLAHLVERKQTSIDLYAMKYFIGGFLASLTLSHFGSKPIHGDHSVVGQGTITWTSQGLEWLGFSTHKQDNQVQQPLQIRHNFSQKSSYNFQKQEVNPLGKCIRSCSIYSPNFHMPFLASPVAPFNNLSSFLAFSAYDMAMQFENWDMTEYLIEQYPCLVETIHSCFPTQNTCYLDYEYNSLSTLLLTKNQSSLSSFNKYYVRFSVKPIFPNVYKRKMTESEINKLWTSFVYDGIVQNKSPDGFIQDYQKHLQELKEIKYQLYMWIKEYKGNNDIHEQETCCASIPWKIDDCLQVLLIANLSITSLVSDIDQPVDINNLPSCLSVPIPYSAHDYRSIEYTRRFIYPLVQNLRQVLKKIN